MPKTAASRNPHLLENAAWAAFFFILLGMLLGLASRPELRSRLLPALFVNLCFAMLAWILRGVTPGGAIAGFLVTSILFIAAGWAVFAAVFLVFFLTYTATRVGKKRKRSLAIAEHSSGRNAAQVLANLGCAAVAAALAQLLPLHFPLLAGSVAALAEAAGDTVSSETGKAFAKTARLVTSWQIVPAGTDGGISLPGTLLGMAAALAIGVETVWAGLLGKRFAVIAVVTGLLGTLLDSLLGATLESRGRLTNNTVNLVSTAVSVALAVAATWQFA